MVGFLSWDDSVKVIKRVRNWPSFFVDWSRFTGRHEPVVVKMRNGMRLLARRRSEDKSLILKILLNREYAPEGFEIGIHDTVVDIGAHIGTFTITSARYAREGIVYAFEPVEANYELLLRNIELNKLKNVVPTKMAVAKDTGEREMFVQENATTGHSFHYRSNRNPVVVDTTSLEAFVDRTGIKRIDLLKMDCEGAEYDILMNCPERIFSMIQRIGMEYHFCEDKKDPQVLVDILKENRFKVTMSNPKDWGGMISRQNGDLSGP
jgi:FkbM family methyltransferase